MHGSVRFLMLLVGTLLLSGCYHARIITGQPESDVVYQKKWVSGFVNGFVIPDDINVSEKCPHGVARVETRLSFLNQIVTLLTGGIYSPMEVRVTCAAPVGAQGLRSTDSASIDRENGTPVYSQEFP